MLKLSASYSKKVPAETDYSSKSYHASVECELPSGLTEPQIKERIARTFQVVRDSVEAELHGTPASLAVVNVETTDHPSEISSQRSRAKAGNKAGTKAGSKASNKQIKYLLDLASNQGIGLAELNAKVVTRFNAATIYDLGRKDASQLLDELKAGTLRTAA